MLVEIHKISYTYTNRTFTIVLLSTCFHYINSYLLLTLQSNPSLDCLKNAAVRAHLHSLCARSGYGPLSMVVNILDRKVIQNCSRKLEIEQTKKQKAISV